MHSWAFEQFTKFPNCEPWLSRESQKPTRGAVESLWKTHHSREALISTDPIPTYSSTNQVHNAPSMQTLSKGEQNSSCLQSGLRAQQRVEADIPSLYQAQTELMQWKTQFRDLQFRGENGSDLVNAF